MQVVIPSRKRSGNIPRMLMMFPDAIVCVAEEEEAEYRPVAPRLLLHPNNLVGLTVIQHWFLHEIQDDVVVSCDDDIDKLAIITGLMKRFTRDPVTINAVLESSAQAARDAGCHLFGYNKEPDVRKYMPQSPFTIRGWADCVIGVIGRTVLPRPRRRVCGGSLDWFLRGMARDKIVWIDNRFSFVHDRFQMAGGNSVNRTEEQWAADLKDLRDQWGSIIQFDGKGKRRLSLKGLDKGVQQ